MRNPHERRDLFEEARDKIDLVGLITSVFGKGKRAGGSMRWRFCPHCGDGGRESSRLAVRSGASKYKCFACGESGGVVDFAVAHWGMQPLDAAASLLNESLDIVPRDHEAERREREEETVKSAARSKISQLLYAELPGRIINVPAMKFFALERGIGKSTMLEALERKLVAFLPQNPSEANGLVREIVGDEILMQAEVLKDVNKRMSIAFREAVIFCHGGTAAEFRIARWPRDGEKKALRYGASDKPWFWEGDSSLRTCVITEGAVDLLSQVALGWKGDVIGLASSNSYKPYWFTNLAKNRVDRFVIRLDNDELKNPDAQTHSGNVWATTIKEQLNAAGIEAEIRLPREGDVNDQLIAFRKKRMAKASG